MKSEYQHGPNRQGGCYPGCFPKKLVLCNSRKPGSAYVQMDIYAVPPGYHGSPHQAATMNHYEFGQTLFFTGGMRTKHTSQTDSSTGMPTIMPASDDASSFPWRWGQHNVAKGKVQTQDYPTLMFGETEHAPTSTNGSANFGPGDYFQYWPVDFSFYQSRRSSSPSTSASPPSSPTRTPPRSAGASAAATPPRPGPPARPCPPPSR